MIRADDPRGVARFVGRAIWGTDEPQWYTHFTAIGRYRSNGTLAGGVIYSHASRWDICLSAAGARGWLTPEMLFCTFDYPFRFLGKLRVTASARVDNVRSRRLLGALGFREEGVLRGAHPDGCADVVYGMLRGECRWISREFLGKLERRQHFASKSI